MKKNKFLLFAAIAMAVLTSCGGGQKGLPTSNEYPVVTIGPANAQLKTTYPATIKGVRGSTSENLGFHHQALCS